MERPTLDELLEAAMEFLEKELLPNITDQRLRFQTLVTLNALGIVRREVALGEALLEEERRELIELLGHEGTLEELLKELSQRIREGTPPKSTVDFLKRHVTRKLRIANPNYLDKYV